MIYRLAVSPHLDTRPLADALDELAPGRVRVVVAEPSALSELLHAGEADAALIPVVDCFRGAGAAVVPGAGVASGRRASGAKLFSRASPTRLRHVAVDRGGRTSVALLRVLLADLYGVQPDFRALEPRLDALLNDHEAALLIGDRALAAARRFRERGPDDVHVVDLVETWRQMTGLPFVFAVWALGRRFVAGAGDAAREDLVGLLTRACELGQARFDALSARAAGETGDVRADCARTRRYALGERELAGLERFHTLCVRHAVCAPARGEAFDARA